LQKGANPNAADSGDFTALHISACNGHGGVVNALLKCSEINVNFQTSKGNTSLHLAAEKGHLEIVKALIAKNAKLDVKNVDGKLASDMAREKKCEEVLDYITKLKND
jgi:uncharacterized protein